MAILKTIEFPEQVLGHTIHIYFIPVGRYCITFLHIKTYGKKKGSDGELKREKSLPFHLPIEVTSFLGIFKNRLCKHLSGVVCPDWILPPCTKIH